MRRKLLAAAGVVAALIGCRTLVGIDDLEFNPGPPQTESDADILDGQIQGCVATANGGCFSCCRTTFTNLARAADEQRGSTCFCQQSTCATQCSVQVAVEAGVVDAGDAGDGGDGGTVFTTTCGVDTTRTAGNGGGGGGGGQTGATTATDDCVHCEDGVLSKPLSSSCSAICDPQDTDCQNGLTCLQQCPQ